MRKNLSELKKVVLHSCVISNSALLLLLTLQSLSIISINVPIILGSFLIFQTVLAISIAPDLYNLAKSPINLPFIRLHLGLAVFSLLYIFTATLFSSGSPFIFEESLSNPQKMRYQEIEPGESILFSYEGAVNNLGIISVPLKGIVVNEFEEQDDLNATNGQIEYLIDFEISRKGEPAFHTATHTIWFNPDSEYYTHPFGFPLQTDSRGQHYEINLRLSPDTDESLSIANNGTVYRSGKYLVPARESLTQLDTTFSIIWEKSKNTIKSQLLYLAFFWSIISITSILFWRYKPSVTFLNSAFSISAILSFAVLQIIQYAIGTSFFADMFLLSTYVLSLSVVSILWWMWNYRSQLLNSVVVVKKATKKSRLHEFALLLAFVLLALALRVPNLEALDPYTDEYPHLIAARQIVEGSPFSEVYGRSLYVVTLPVAAALSVFGFELWAARMVGVLFNVLAIFPLFLIMKRFGSMSALIAVFLYATSPWLIAVSRNVREYAYYPFYFYSVLLMMTALYDRIPTKWDIGSIFRLVLEWKTSVLLSLLALVAGFVLFVDPLSTGKVLLITYAVFAGLIVSKMNWRHWQTLVCLIFLILISSGGLIWFSLQQGFVSLVPSLNEYWIQFFVPEASGQWYYQLVPLSFILMPAMALMYGFLVRKRSTLILFFVVLFAAYWYFYVFHFDRYSRPRYGMSIQFWYVLVMSLGLSGLFHVIQYSVRGKIYRWILAISLLFITWNPAQSLLPMQMSTPGYVPITNEYHDNLRVVHEFMKENVMDGDVLVHSLYNNYVLWSGDLEFEDVYKYNYVEDSYGDIASFMAQYESGWIVLDFRRGEYWSKPILDENLINNLYNLKYVGTYNGVSVYNWRY
jgi:hypothetical protein